MDKRIPAGYVRTEQGKILLQLPAENPFGFVLASDDQAWPGGVGIADAWVLIPASEVPEADKKRLGWILKEVER